MRGINRSSASCFSTDMQWLFGFSLLLTYLPVTESMKKAESCLSQPTKVFSHKTGQNAVLPCTLNSKCSAHSWRYEWFTFKENQHLRLNLSNFVKYTLDGASLHIHSLHPTDSGIYHCAGVSLGDPAQGTQYVGMGTTLVVKEKVKIMVKSILLWLSFVLLSIYSLAIVMLMVKKCGCKRKHKTVKGNSTKKRQFRDVLQEMYSRRNLERGKQAVSRGRSQAEAASVDLNTSTDDIYQNV